MDITNNIHSNANLKFDSGALKATQAVEAVQPVQGQQEGSQQALRSTEQEPRISQEGARLATAASGNDGDDRSFAIRNSAEAQKVINQLFQDIQSNPAQAGQSQRVSAATVSALVGGR